MFVNIAPFNEEKKVCIIVPVYNAEKYLGYSLNSILSQTYTNWTAILVDDGSTDSSLEICRHYESIDHRFHVISKTNGGVSSARNAGLALADGDYLEFLDSDDCLTQDALEKQVGLALENNRQLVVMNAVILDFNNPEGARVTLCSNWLKESPCVLSADEFREKRMRLIWFTALLEGPCAKLYDLALWKQLDLRFPEDLSLGEDFVTNMKYYNACNGAVFLNECGYYYNQYMGSGSLTEKYRPDLFEIKMYLIEKLEEHLGGRENLSEPELDTFYCYAASSGLVCMEKTVLTSGLDDTQLLERMQELCAHPLFAESIRRATYIPERFVACLEPIKENDLKQVIQYIANDMYKKAQQTVDVETTDKPETNAGTAMVPVPNSGVLNRIIRGIMRVIITLLGHSNLGERLTRLERELAQYGLKCTIQAHTNIRKKATKKQLTEQISELHAEVDSLASTLIKKFETQASVADDKISNTTAQIQKIEVKISGAAIQLQEVDNKISGAAIQLQEVDNKISSAAIQLQEVDNKISSAAAQIQENVNGYIWITEQRMHKYAYQRDINELRQRKKAIMLATAEHANIGDAAITLAEQQFLSQYFPEYFQVEISTYEFDQKEAYLYAILNSKDIIFINGGGNMGDRYSEEEELHRKIVSEFPNNKIIIFPQTISFSATEKGALELAKSARIYNSHNDLTLFVRGETSLAFANKHFDKVTNVLMPDMVHMLRSKYPFGRSGTLLCLRDDAERSMNDTTAKDIQEIALTLTGSVDRSSNIHTEDVTREIRGLVVRKELMRFARHQLVITDRLHGMIFAAITGTPCVVLASYDHKIQEYYDAFFRDANAVFFIGNDEEQLENAIKKALQVTSAQYPIFEGEPYRAIREICVDSKETPDQRIH